MLKYCNITKFQDSMENPCSIKYQDELRCLQSAIQKCSLQTDLTISCQSVTCLLELPSGFSRVSCSLLWDLDDCQASGDGGRSKKDQVSNVLGAAYILPFCCTLKKIKLPVSNSGHYETTGLHYFLHLQR